MLVFLSGIASTWNVNFLRFIRLTLSVKCEWSSELKVPQMIVNMQIVAAWSFSEKWYKWYLARTLHASHPWDQGDSDNTWTGIGCCQAFQNCKLREWGYLTLRITCFCRNRAIQKHSWKWWKCFKNTMWQSLHILVVRWYCFTSTQKFQPPPHSSSQTGFVQMSSGISYTEKERR